MYALSKRKRVSHKKDPSTDIVHNPSFRVNLHSRAASDSVLNDYERPVRIRNYIYGFFDRRDRNDIHSWRRLSTGILGRALKRGSIGRLDSALFDSLGI